MDKSHCYYCGKRDNLKQCPHCKKYFDSEHFNPIEPGSYHPEKSRLFINRIRLSYQKTHPCPDYVDYLEQQKKIQDIKYGEALDLLSGRKPNYKLPLSERQQIREERYKIAKENEALNTRLNLRLEENIQKRKDEKLKRKELERERHRQEIKEKERLTKEIKEKQVKHLEEQEKNQSISNLSERIFKEPPKVMEKYRTEHVGTKTQDNKINWYSKIKFWFKKLF